jgi:hypothetical protein
MYDLNDNGFDAKQGVTIFNDGKQKRISQMLLTTKLSFQIKMVENVLLLIGMLLKIPSIIL